MEDIFITKIDIEKSRNLENARNLENVSIPLSETERKHLILTGRNGSGKTSLLHNLDKQFDFKRYQSDFYDPKYRVKNLIYNDEKSKIRLNISKHRSHIYEAWNSNSFITVFFRALRNVTINTPQKIEKLNIWDGKQYTNDKLDKYFLQFLVNQKADRSFAKDDGDSITVQRIDDWFDLLKKRLQDVFETDKLELKFRRRDYTFDILIPGREPFGFEVLSDGYSSIISIMAELIIRMEKLKKDSLTYDLEGIVLIDEIETHLHVSLQKIILPFLIDFFPKIQFIVSTHSPFVLSSISNAVIFDLENETVIEDLSLYSYDAIIESYFDSDKYSEIIKKKIEEYDSLSLIEDLKPEQIEKIRHLKDYFAHAPKYLAPELHAKLLEIELRSVQSKTAG